MNLINNSLLSYYVRRGRRSTWTPDALFAQGQQGVWYEPKPQYLFQDAAGTVPVTADGDPVGMMLDLSGNGNHATQSASARRPIYRTDGALHWLATDGADDFLTFPGLNLNQGSMAFALADELSSPLDRRAIVSAGVSGYLVTIGSPRKLAINYSANTWLVDTPEDFLVADRVFRVSMLGGGVISARDAGSDLEHTNSVAGRADGLSSARLLFAFDESAAIPFQGRFYCGILRVSQFTAEEDQPTLDYLAKLRGL